MLARHALRPICIAACVAGGIGFAEAAEAQPFLPQPVSLNIPPPPPYNDMDMPADMGAALAGAVPDRASPAVGSRSMSVNTPIAAIAANPQGKAVLERELPGLCERPEYMMFKTMSLATLARMSHGRITPSKLDAIQANLVQVSVATP